MLRPSIQKPQVLCSNDPILAYGFLNLIALFEKLTVDLYDWLSTGGSPNSSTSTDQASTASTASSIQASLCAAPIASLQGIMEIQQVDILVTQQWLQTMMWRVSLAASPSSKDGNLPFHLPVVIGRAVMGIISAASQAAVDAHGIGMEQKLYDLGTSIAKVSSTSAVKPRPQSQPRLQAQTQTQTSANEDTLWSILKTLARIRGSQSHLLPRLLEHCTPVLRLDGALTISDYLPVLGADSRVGRVGCVGVDVSPTTDLSSDNNTSSSSLVRHKSGQDPAREDPVRGACNGWAGYSC